MQIDAHTNGRFEIWNVSREDLADIKQGLEARLGAYQESLADPNNRDDTMWLHGRIAHVTDAIVAISAHL